METSVHSWKWAGGAGMFEHESTRDKVAKGTLVACNLRRMKGDVPRVHVPPLPTWAVGY